MSFSFSGRPKAPRFTVLFDELCVIYAVETDLQAGADYKYEVV